MAKGNYSAVSEFILLGLTDNPELIYCGPSVINHFYCDDVSLLALACSDTSLKEILTFIFSGFNMISSLTMVLISYLYIVAAILRIQSAEGRRKAFSSCGSHLTALTIFYGTLIVMYLQPKSNHSLDTDKMASVFYTIVIPLLNPMIYSLRNQSHREQGYPLVTVCELLIVEASLLQSRDSPLLGFSSCDARA
ncbi:hypothetical protein G4228_017274 [Cervus hanglu yarkandensis]|nr:hypothetical protein G4228_017274 [Cervus hanglu yarkandensis]